MSDLPNRNFAQIQQCFVELILISNILCFPYTGKNFFNEKENVNRSMCFGSRLSVRLTIPKYPEI